MSASRAAGVASIGLVAGIVFALAIANTVSGKLAAIPAPWWIVPVIRRPLGMFAWSMFTFQLPIALLAGLAGALLGLLLPRSPLLAACAALVGWLLASLAVNDWQLGWIVASGRSMAGFLSLNVLVACGFLGGARLVSAPGSIYRLDA